MAKKQKCASTWPSNGDMRMPIRLLRSASRVQYAIRAFYDFLIICLFVNEIFVSVCLKWLANQRRRRGKYKTFSNARARLTHQRAFSFGWCTAHGAINSVHILQWKNGHWRQRQQAATAAMPPMHI